MEEFIAQHSNTLLIAAFGLINICLTAYLTTKVERVKTAFSKENENVKSQLSVLTNKKNLLFNEEKEAIHEFLSAWLIWYTKVSSLGIEYTSLVSADYSDLDTKMDNHDEFSRVVEDEFNKVQMSMAKLELFITNIEIFNSANNLCKKTRELQGTTTTYLINYVVHKTKRVSKINPLQDPQSRTRAFRQASFLLEPSVGNNAMKGLIEELEQMKLTYENDNHAKLKEVFGAKDNFVKLSREFIRKDI